LAYMEQTAVEREAVLDGLGQDEAGLRDKMACAGFLMNLYGGAEKILLRICRHRGLTVPTGGDWHSELVTMFSTARCPDQGFIGDELLHTLVPFRRLRHVVVHGYALTLDWQRMLPGAQSARKVFAAFDKAVREYLDSLEGGPAPDHNPAK